MSLSDLIKLLGGVSLFLFGMTVMGDSLKKVAGSKLEVFLYKLTDSPIKGILLGTGVTAIIQSSSATSAMVVGFVNSGMMKLKQAIGIIMGAIIGTSITGWIISLSYIGTGSSGILELLSTSSLSAVIGVIGIALIMFSKKRKQKNIGEILLGFTVLMVGMEQMSSSVSGLRSDPVFLNLFVTLSNPLLGILFGLAFTALIQSASAAVGIIQALSTTGVITLNTAVPIMVGIAIGASLPVIISSIGANGEAKKAAFSYLVIDFLGGIIVTILFYISSIWLKQQYEVIVNPVSVALVNTILRIIMIVILSPFIDVIERIVDFIIKDDNSKDEMLQEVYKLEDRFLEYPPLAIENVSAAINAMADKTLSITFASMELLNNYSEKGYEEVEKKEEIIDEYEDRINVYLTKVASRSLTGYQSRLVGRYLRSVGDLERISDHALNIAQIATKMSEENISFSNESKKELDVLYNAIKMVTTMAVNSFIANDEETSYKIQPLEQVIDKITDQLGENHIFRLQNGGCNIENSYVFNDILNNYERVSDHCSNISLATIGLYKKELDTHNYEIEIRKEDKFKELYKEYLEVLNYSRIDKKC